MAKWCLVRQFVQKMKKINTVKLHFFNIQEDELR